MATADISKEAVFDSRIVQLPARYAVNKSALSLTNSPYQAISATASQHTYNINVPSQNVFVDRAVDWSSGVRLFFNVSIAAGTPAAVGNEAVVVFGRDAALTAFPLNSLVNTATSTINDTSTTINTDSVLREVLRLVDYKKNRLCRTTPTKLDTAADYTEMANGIFSVLADFLAQTESAERPNGAWWDIDFINPQTGLVLSGNGTYPNPTGGNVSFVSGIPVRSTPDLGTYQIAVQFRATEKIVLSPFIFADAAEWETGLFGINNIQLVFNMKADISRTIRNNRKNGRQISGVAYPNNSLSPFIDPRVNVQYLTPSLDIPLPPKSVVQYMEFPRYLSTYNGTLAPKSTTSSIPSTTIVLPQIPDALLIYMKPQDYQLGSGVAGFTNTQGDWYLPIKKISCNFDNFAGLLSSHTAEQLYQMSVHNGLEMDYDQWSGLAVSASVGAANITGGITNYQPFKIQSVGGFLVLKPGLDITLQSGQAPGLIGNFTLQFNVDVFNPSTIAVNNPILYVIAVNSGFFETLAGSSRIVKGVLSEADIIGAAPAAEMTHEGLSRMVGHGFMDKVGSFLTKARDIYTATKPAVSAIKGMMPEGKVKDVLGAVGYGAAGAGRAGGMKKSLAARLM
jgi:hypothetical protein